MAIFKASRPLPEFNLVEVLKEKFGQVRPSSNGWLRIECPTCDSKDSKKMKRYVNSASGRSNCYICGKPMQFHELTGQALVRGESTADYVKEEHPMSRVLPFTAATPINKLPHDHRAVQFLFKDHLYDLDLYADTYGVVFIEYADGLEIETSNDYLLRIAECILFPVFHEGELVGWQARFIPGHWYSDKKDKMRYFHIFPKGEYLFGYDEAKAFNFCVLVEGAKKAMKAPYCVASLGKGLTDTQLGLLAKWPMIVIMLDGDAKTQEQALQYKYRLEARFKKVVNINPSDFGCASPDEMTQDQVYQAVADALQSVDYTPEHTNVTL